MVKFSTTSLTGYSTEHTSKIKDQNPQPEGRRLEKSLLAWDDSSSAVGVTIALDREVKYQQIIGCVAFCAFCHLALFFWISAKLTST